MYTYRDTSGTLTSSTLEDQVSYFLTLGLGCWSAIECLQRCVRLPEHLSAITSHLCVKGHIQRNTEPPKSLQWNLTIGIADLLSGELSLAMFFFFFFLIFECLCSPL